MAQVNKARSPISSLARGLILNLGALVAGCVLLYVARDFKDEYREVAKSVAVIIITGGFFAWWGAYHARLEIASKVGGLLDLRDAVVKSGIHDVTPWKLDIPRDALVVDMLLVRGHGWFKNQAVALRSCLENKKAIIRICLLHPESPSVSALADKYNEKEHELRQKIQDTVNLLRDELTNCQRSGPCGNLEVRAHKLVPTYSYYRFDNVHYMAWYTIRRGRWDIPCLHLVDGTLTDFFVEDFEASWEDPSTVTLLSSNK